MCVLPFAAITPAAQSAPPPDRVAAGQLVALVNAERAAARLSPLTLSQPAIDAAEAWSAHMADTNELAHNDAWFTPESKAKALAKTVGENVAYNIDIADAHRRLVASPEHRANIFDPRFHAMGAGVVRGATGALWITETFVELKPVAHVLALVPAPPLPSVPLPVAAPPSPPQAPAPTPTAAPAATTDAALTHTTSAASPADASGSNSPASAGARRPRTNRGEVASGPIPGPTAGPSRRPVVAIVAMVAIALNSFGLIAAIRRERWQASAS